MILWLAAKVFALILIAVGVFLVFFFPGTAQHQDSMGRVEFSLTGITLGIIMLIFGVFLLFAP